MESRMKALRPRGGTGRGQKHERVRLEGEVGSLEEAMMRERWRKEAKPTGGTWLTTCPVVPFTDPTRGNLWVSELGEIHAAWGALAIPSGNSVARSVAQSSKVGKVESSIPKGPQGQAHPQSPIWIGTRA